MFSNCWKLKNISMPTVVQSSGDYLFSNCSSLPTKLYFPKLKEITGSKLFYGLEKIFSIYGDSIIDSFMRENYVFNPTNKESTDDYVAEDFTYSEEGVLCENPEEVKEEEVQEKIVLSWYEWFSIGISLVILALVFLGGKKK